MTAIMISIRPKWVAMELNGDKTAEARARFPKDYRGWVYIYCTKGDEDCFKNKSFKYYCYCSIERPENKKWFENQAHIQMLNGKVVARFYCDLVEEIMIAKTIGVPARFTKTLTETELCRKTCLTPYDFNDYLGNKTGYAIHISKLEIFDKPKELSEFEHETKTRDNVRGYIYDIKPLTKAPQSWCYIKIGE